MSVSRELSVVEGVGAVRPVPQGVALLLGVEAKAERRDIDETVKEAIDDDAEPTGCNLGSAIPPTWKTSPRPPDPCAMSRRIQTTADRSLTVDSSATALFYTRKIFVVDPVRLGPRRQAASASTWTR